MSFAITDQTKRWSITIPASNLSGPVSDFPVRLTGAHIPAAAWTELADEWPD